MSSPTRPPQCPSRVARGVPTHTFADVDADPALRPDVVVVPGLTKPYGAAEAPLRTWVTRQHEHGAKVLGVCSGAMVLAETGMLDGLDATSHWSRISALQKSRPAAHWLRGRVYVEDGSVTTTAAVTSGVPGSLHLVAELAGAAEAQRVANLHPELDWSPAGRRHPRGPLRCPGLACRPQQPEPWFRPTVGIALTRPRRRARRHRCVRGVHAVSRRPHHRASHGRHGAHPPRPGAAHHQLLPRPGAVACRRPRHHHTHRHRAKAARLGRGPPGSPWKPSTAGSVPPCRTSPSTPTPATTSATAKMIGYPTEGPRPGQRAPVVADPSAGPGCPRTRSPRGTHSRMADPAPTTPPPGERRH